MTAAVPFMSAPAAYAFEDASHTGMTYLEVQINTGGNNLNGVVNTEGQFNSWGGSDVAQSTEYKKEQITWGAKNWAHTVALLGGANTNASAPPEKAEKGEMITKAAPDVPDGLGKEGNLFTTSAKGADFKDKTSELHEDGYGGSEAVSLTMSFPGWGAGDRIPDVTTGSNTAVHATAGGDRNNKDDGTFSSIDGTAASNAASAVNNKLIGDLNAAIQDFTARMRTKDGKKVQLSREGLINVVWLLANGYFPKPGSTVEYDQNTSAVNMTNLQKGQIQVPDKPWKRTTAGEAVAYFKPASGRTSTQSGEEYNYTYAVVKGYDGGVGDPGSKTFGSDAYALSWYDVAMAISAQVAYNTVEDQSEASSTVVGDQVGSFMYTMISGLLSILQVKKVDDLVFGEAGNLLKGGVFNILMVVQTPFIIASILILGLVILDAYRKSNMAYLSTGEQRSIMSSVGRVTNALIAIALTPLGVMLLIYLDQEIVKFAIGINSVFAGFNYGTSFSTAMESLDWVGTAINGVSGLGVNAILAIILAGVDIKYTWRYIARAISFALYFCMAPVLFALDALKGNGRLFEFGPTAGMIWKNLTGTVLMRSVDALGIVFSLHLGRILFGSGMLIKILSLLSAEAITNTVASMLGVSDTSVKGIAEAGRGLFNKGMGMIAAGGAAVGTAMGSKALTGYLSGRNKDHEEVIKQKLGDKTKKPQAGDLPADFNSEVPTTSKKTKKANAGLDAVQKAPSGSTGVPEAGAGGGSGVSLAIADGADAGAEGGTGTVTLAGGGSGDYDMGEEAVPVSGAVAVADTGYEAPVVNNGLGDKAGETTSSTSDAEYDKADARRKKMEEKAKTQSNWGSLANLVKQGYETRGLHGDKNTVEGGGMRVPNAYKVNHEDYELDSRGRVRPRTKQVAARDRRRNIMRGLGAAASTVRMNDGENGSFLGSSFAKTVGMGLFAATSTITPGKLDNYAAAAIATNMAQNTFTGDAKSSVLSNFSRSFIGRALGAKEGAFTFDEITADGDGYRSAMGGEASTEASKEMAKYRTTTGLRQDGQLQTRTSFDGSVKSKADKAAHVAAAGLHARGTHSHDGMTTMSLNQVIDSIDDNAFGQVNPQYAQLAQYMTENDYDKMRFDGENVAFDKTMQATETVEVADAQPGGFEAWVGNNLRQSKDHSYREQSGAIYKLNADGNATIFNDTGAEARATMAHYYGGQTAAALKAGDGAELKSLLREQNQMPRDPQAFLKAQEERKAAAAAAKAAREAAGVEETTPSPKLSKREPITRGKQPQD